MVYRFRGFKDGRTLLILGSARIHGAGHNVSEFLGRPCKLCRRSWRGGPRFREVDDRRCPPRPRRPTKREVETRG